LQSITQITKDTTKKIIKKHHVMDTKRFTIHDWNWQTVSCTFAADMRLGMLWWVIWTRHFYEAIVVSRKWNESFGKR